MDWLFATDKFVPFHEAQRWSPEMRHIWILSNVCIALCCYGLAIGLVWVWHKRRNTVVSPLMLFTFGLYLVFLGTTFAISIVTMYWAPYRFMVTVRGFCAIFAVLVALKLPFIVVNILKLPSRELMHSLNNRLNSELLQKQANEEDLKKRNRELASRILRIETTVEQCEWFHKKSETVQQLREMLYTVGGPG